MTKKKVKSIRCWQCDDDISLEHAGNTCPNCHASLTAANYDAAAKPFVFDLEAAWREHSELNKVFSQTNRELRKRDILSIILWPYHALKSKYLSRKLDMIECRRKQCTSHLEAYATARYLCSYWYRETAILPKFLGGNNNLFSGIKYNSSGELVVAPKSGSMSSRGLVGEFRAFDLLSKYLELGYFGYARLLASVAVPYDNNWTRQKSCVEIDMILITQKRVFVFEVKNFYGNVKVKFSKNPGYEISVEYKGKKGDMFSSERKDDGIAQNTYHCIVLKDVLKKHYLHWQITNVLIYLNNVGFTEPMYQGRKGVYVLSDKVGSSFAPDVVRDINRGHERSRKDVDALYTFLKKCSDPAGEISKEYRRKVHGAANVNKMLRQLRVALRS